MTSSLWGDHIGPMSALGTKDRHGSKRPPSHGSRSPGTSTGPDLSGGEFQRSRIARLLREAELLILDEPTAHLDLGHAHGLAQELNALQWQGLGLLAAVHDLNIVALYFERVILLSEGRVIADGPVGDVMTQTRLETIFQTKCTWWNIQILGAHNFLQPQSGQPS